MENKDKLLKQLETINNLIIDEIENLKYLLDNTLISNINLINISYNINQLINKREGIKNDLYLNYDIIINDEI